MSTGAPSSSDNRLSSNSSWRRGPPSSSQQQQPRPPNMPRDRSNTPIRSGNGTPANNTGGASGPPAAAPGNAWSADNRSRKQSPATGAAGPSGRAPAASRSPAITPVEVDGTHVPVNGFNAAAVRDVMKKSYTDAVAAAGDPKSVHYKLPADSAAQPKSAAPWAARPNVMANGRDFWVEFAKQVKAADQRQQGGQKGEKPTAGSGSGEEAGQKRKGN